MKKRIFDVVLASLGLILISPIFVIISIFILKTNGKPIFFIQKRPGKQAKIFRMFKFRTMLVSGTEGQISDAERLTPFGKFLRRTSLDEIPELINVLIGDMSLVGPRPLLPEYLDRYTLRQRHRHFLKPGMTGLAQVMGRNQLSWNKRFACDIFYVRNQSLCLDLWIICKTICILFNQKGADFHGEKNMKKFGE